MAVRESDLPLLDVDGTIIEMSLKSDLEYHAKSIFKTKWSRRAGKVVPEDKSVTLGNDAVEIEGTILYADLADSTKLVDGYRDWFAAEVYKSFLYCAGRIISSEGGTITAYDGDRVMAVFIGDSKNTSAVRAALKINWSAKNIIRPAIQAEWPNTTFLLNHVCGIDSSKLFVAKTGVRGANDLVWVGRAANYAAKLSAEDHVNATWITDAVHSQIADQVKLSGGVDIWKPYTWTVMNNIRIWASTYWMALT
jgi:class 3 adenylate cyclase